MTFDPCEHKIRQIVIQAAREIRKAKGLPEENNITVLFNEVAPVLGIPVLTTMTSRNVDHLPAPHESVDQDGKFIIPRKDCPSCNKKEGLMLTPLCASCEDAEGGKYKTAWVCMDCKFKEKSSKFFSQWLNELGVPIPEGFKQAMGIKTLTDEGLK